MQSEAWPAYDAGKHDHVHAMGVVAVNFNTLENLLLSLLHLYFNAEYALAQKLFLKLTNHGRIDTLKELVRTRESRPEVRCLIDNFLDGFVICAENRNILMHSLYLGPKYGSDNMHMAKFSAKQPVKFNTYSFQLIKVRRVADDIWRFRKIGEDIYYNIRFTDYPVAGAHYVPLPEKLAMPEKLEPEGG